MPCHATRMMFCARLLLGPTWWKSVAVRTETRQPVLWREIEAAAEAGLGIVPPPAKRPKNVSGRGLHSFTFQLNFSRF